MVTLPTSALAEREDHALRVVAAFTRIADRVAPIALELFEDWLHCCATFDENHPASLGCLLALVREAWGQRATLSPISMGGAWRVGDSYGWTSESQDTEAGSLVAALESAPAVG